MNRLLEQIDSALSSGDFSRAEEICNRLISQSDRDCEQAMIARESLAQIKMRGGEYTCAARMFEELISIATDLDNRSMAGRGYLSLGTAYFRLGDHHRAEDYYRAALHVFRWQVCDTQWVARCHANLGILFKTSGKWRDALENLTLGAAESRQAHDDANGSVILLSKCILMRKEGLLDEAWDACRESLELARKSKHRPAVCNCCLESANISILRKDLNTARHRLARAASLARRHGYRREQVICSEIRGDIAYAEGDLAQTCSAYGEALAFALELGVRSDLISEVSRRIAMVEMDSGNFDEAFAHGKKAVDVAREIGDKWELGVSLRVMGQVCVVRGEIGLAIAAMEESIAVLKGLSADCHELGISEEALSKILLNRGNVGDLKCSRDHLLMARQIFGRLGWHVHVNEIDRLLGEIEMDHGLFTDNEVGVSRCREEIAGKYGLDPAQYGLITTDERIVGDLSRWGGTDVRVLIEGETGVGKELVARTLHALGRRREHRFVAVDCGALSETLADSELFGHVKGSFTGALRDRVGLIEEADGGTLLLDEVGELSEMLQTKLLRVLEERTVRRVGENTYRPIDIRVMSATTRDLGQAVEEGHFRRDLYYRLKGVLIRVPALRERRGDIDLLLDHFLRTQSERYGKTIRLSRKARMMLREYDWPGNVRELKNTVEALAASSEDKTVVTADLLDRLMLSPHRESDHPRRLKEIEQEEIERVLSVCGGNKSKAAKMLGITRKTLYSRLSRE